MLTEQVRQALRDFANGIRTDIRATLAQIDDIYEGDTRRKAIVAAASMVATVAELGLDQADALLSDPPRPPDEAATRSAATFMLRFAAGQCHTESLADCPHCRGAFLAHWVLDLLGPEPIRERPPGPPDPPTRATKPVITTHPSPEVEA